MCARKILLVDDDPEDKNIILDAMEMIGQQEAIHFAENGEQALRILKDCMQNDQLPCLVVLDLNMPIMNGTETLKHIKSHERLKNIPVVIYSTSINNLEKEKCLSLGALDYIIKPISFKQSKEIVQKLLSFCTTDGIFNMVR